MKKVDLVVIGSGPGGYVSALRAAQNGAEVVLVEKEALGGTCLNWGCVPTKVLAKTAEIYKQTAKLPDMGINLASPATLDYSVVQKRKLQVVENLKYGLTQLLGHRQVEVLQGEATILQPGKVQVLGEGNETQEIETGKIIIATGSRPMNLPGLEFDGQQVISSKEALALTEVPSSLLIVGCGVVGLEFASIYRRFGAEVVLVELLPDILPFIDREVTEGLKFELSNAGIAIHTSTRAVGVDKGSSTVSVTLDNGEKQWQVEVEKVLVAAGRSLNSAIGDNLGITRKGAIAVNEMMETSVPGIYAVGDVTGNYQLANVAYHEALVAADNATGTRSTVDYRCVPQAIFTLPEVAGVGITEEEARKNYDVTTGIYPYASSAKAMAGNDTTGFVKIIAEKRHHEILGAFLIGPAATELIHEVLLAIKLEATLDDIAETIHAHPVLSETLFEASWLAMQKPLHFM